MSGNLSQDNVFVTGKKTTAIKRRYKRVVLCTKKNILFFVLVVVATGLQSCGGLAAGIINREVIEKNPEQYVAQRVAKLKPLDLDPSQMEKAESIYLEEITNLKENAHKEKTKEISNKASLNNLKYHVYIAELGIHKILTPEQLSEYQNNDIYNGLTDEEMRKARKHLLKKGFILNE